MATKLKVTLAALVISTIMGIPIAHADNPVLIKCPDNTHVWSKSQCNNSPPGFGNNPGGGGDLGLVGRVLRSLGIL